MNDYLSELCPVKAFPAFIEFGLDSFSVDREWDENDFTVVLGDTGSSKRDVTDF